MRVLVTGGTGFVGTHVVQRLVEERHLVVSASRSAAGVVPAGEGASVAAPGGPRLEHLPVDLAAGDVAAGLLDRCAPEAVIDLAAVPDIAPCAEDPALARALNARWPGELAVACAARGVRLVHVSTDQVFDGSRGGWSEGDEPRPLHLYGKTKLAGERAVAAADPRAAVVRPGLVTGAAPLGRRSSTSGLLRALRAAAGGAPPPRMFTDELRSPVAVTDLARALVRLALLPDASGLFHAGGPEVLSRHGLALREADRAGLDRALVGAGTREEAGQADVRPRDLSLDSGRLVAILDWQPRALAD